MEIFSARSLTGVGNSTNDSSIKTYSVPPTDRLWKTPGGRATILFPERSTVKEKCLPVNVPFNGTNDSLLFDRYLKIK